MALGLRGLHKKPLLLFLAIALVYLAPGRKPENWDALPARYLPLSILREFDLDLDEFPFLYEEVLQYYLQYSKGHYVSTFPPGPPLLATPVYLLPVLSGLAPPSPWLPFLEKLSATMIAALSAIFLYLALRRLTAARIALMIVLVYAFGTSTFSVSSQSLWQHGPSQLLLAMTIYWLVRGLHERWFVPFAGFTLAGAVVCRPTNLLIALPIALYVLHKHRGEFIQFVVFALPPILFLLDYNQRYFGSFFDTGYGKSLSNPFSFWWQNSLIEGLLSVLVSPARGLLIYSPIFLFSCVGIVLIWKRHKEPLLRYLSLAPLPIIFLFAKLNWWGGWSYGPRYMADITPFLSLCLYPVYEFADRRRYLQCLLAGFTAISIGMHAIGAFGYDMSWEETLAEETHHDRYWSWTHSPFRHYGGKTLLGLMEHYLWAKKVILRLPDSADGPDALAASYDIQGLPERVAAFEPFALSVNVTNTGKAVWRAQTGDKRGMVQFIWRWFKDGHEVPNGLGAVSLEHDIFPGETYTSRVRIWPPLRPGAYALELRMISQNISWFREHVHQTLQVVSPVPEDTACAFDPLLERLQTSFDNPPALRVNTDKTVYHIGEVSAVMISAAHDGKPGEFAAYLALGRPDGAVSFFGNVSHDPCSLWIMQKMAFPLWQGYRWEEYPIMALRTHRMSPGTYTWYFFMTEPYSYHIIAKAKATFSLLP
jgi:hypothetical protein